jgi:hypothetical protein
MRDAGILPLGAADGPGAPLYYTARDLERGTAMLANLLLLRAAWPAGIADWIGLVALGFVTSAGVYVVLRYLARRRQS